MNKVLIICGPTATGKTKLAATLAKQFDGELISIDSRQAYKDVDSLTGKDRQDLGQTKIWLYDIVDVREEFSVGQFESLAVEAMSDIHKRGKMPILVGGTGLYLKAITGSLSLIHVPPNQDVRRKFAQAPRELLQKELQKINPDKWEHMNQSDRSNPRRLIRAIEVALAAAPSKEDKKTFDVLWIGLTAPIEILKQRIEQRVRERWERAVEEVKKLGQTSKTSSTILGLVEIRGYLAGTLTQEDAIRKWITKERQYAKRQMTWFQKQSGIHWLAITSPRYYEEATMLVSSWYPKGDPAHPRSFDNSTSSKSA